ncbi:MAG TPA: hypothetical protein VHU40_10990 [Polyangia bacterium]|jgi:hypothetical protein|nr:hypothetical protein [Polyangia bacterium]
MVRLVRSILLLLMVLATPLRAWAGARVTDEKLGLAVTVPDGFQVAPAPAADGKPTPLVFTRGEVNTASFVALQFVPLRGTIGREKLDRKIVEDSARAATKGTGASIDAFEYRTARWKAFDLELIVGRVSNQERQLVTFSTQVPLVRHALQVSMMGAAADEARLAREFQATLASLEGESSWLTDEQRSERLGRMVGMVVGGAVGIGVVLWLVRRRQRRA